MDFLILYEHTTRELENSCLLGEELKKRGYSVKVECIYSLKRFLYRPKVLITPHLYDDNQVEDFAANIWGSVENIIDLQYEQVLSKKDIESNHHIPKGAAVDSYHIAWGNDQYNRYKNSGISENNIRLTGSISMDLNHERFEDVFFTKNDISKIYNIPAEKEWILFISSFSLCNRSEEEIKRYEQKLKSIRILADISNKSRKEILKWLELSIIEFPDKIFIYRPHPAEKEESELKKIECKYCNFRIIPDYSMRQWAKVVERSYTWFSTSIVDYYYINKNCEILRPYKIPSDIDIPFMRNARTIQTFEEFYETLQQDYNEKEFPIKSDNIIEYYGEFNDGHAYLRVADLCESALKIDKKPYKKLYRLKLNCKAIKILFYGAAYELCKHFKMSRLMKKILSEKCILNFERAEKEMYRTNKEKRFYQMKFKQLLRTIN